MYTADATRELKLNHLRQQELMNDAEMYRLHQEMVAETEISSLAPVMAWVGDFLIDAGMRMKSYYEQKVSEPAHVPQT